MREALIDANVLVRYLTDEPRELADRATGLMEAAEQSRVPILVASVTVAEVVYVLGRVYGWERQETSARLLELIGAGIFTLLEHEPIVQALIWFKDIPRVNFADVYLGALANARDRSPVMSFDRAMRHIPGLTVVADAAELSAN
jgi:predicted nucleic acid-binding protein